MTVLRYTPTHLNYRAAGQAIGAILVGADVLEVTGKGARIRWPRRPAGARRPDTETCAEMLAVLTGLASLDRYGFGSTGKPLILPPGPDMTIALGDYIEADALSADLTIDGFRHWQETWRYAAELVSQEDVWNSIEAVVTRLAVGPLPGRELVQIAAVAGRAR